MSLQRNLLALSISAALSVIAACGGGGGGTTPAPIAAATSAGTLFDGAVAGASVFCDANSNGKFDTGEEQVSTDDAGKFTFVTGCKGKVTSVANTGTDKQTNKAPRGSFSAAAGSSYVTPFTTMLAESGLSLADFQLVMSKLGLGNIDPGSFNPGKDDATLQASMAVAKIMNDLAAVVEAAGGDPKAAFAAAAKTLATQVNSTTVSSGSIFDNDTSLSSLIESAAKGAFASVPGWTTQQQNNAAKIAREAVKAAAKAIKSAADSKSAEDSFNNEGSADLVKQKSDDGTLSDDTKSNDEANKAKTDDSLTKAQYVAIDNVLIFATPTAAPLTLDANQLATTAGSDVKGLTLATINRLQLGTHATSKALPSGGKVVELAVEVTEAGSQRKLQLSIDKVKLSLGTTGNLQMTVLAGAKLNYYAKSGTGVELFPTAAIENVAANSLSTSDAGPAIEFATIIDRVTADLGNDATKTALLNGLLGTTGSFTVKVLVTEIDLRAALLVSTKLVDTKLASSSITLPQAGNSKSTDTLRGAVFTGHINFVK
jgi:hypothetical protein